MLEEQEDVSSCHLEHYPVVEDNKGGKVDCQGLCSKWDQQSDQNTLEDVTFKCQKGQLMAIIGSVGSGKVAITSTTCIRHF